MTSMPRTALLLAALAASSAFASVAIAQDATLAAPAPKHKPKAAKASTQQTPSGDRKPGELEGWTTSSSAVAPAAKSRKLPPGVVSERTQPDGGIPLPAERGNDIAPPIAIDSNGRPSGMFRF